MHAVGYYCTCVSFRSEKFHTLSLDIADVVRLRILNHKRKEIIHTILGENAPPGTEVKVQKKDDIMMVVWQNYGQLTINYLQSDSKFRNL